VDWAFAGQIEEGGPLLACARKCKYAVVTHINSWWRQKEIQFAASHWLHSQVQNLKWESLLAKICYFFHTWLGGVKPFPFFCPPISILLVSVTTVFFLVFVCLSSLCLSSGQLFHIFILHVLRGDRQWTCQELWKG
jgi:hypothetical protein